MNTNESGDNNYSTKISKLQVSLVTQLFQVGATAQHVDELFQWLAYAIVDHFDIQVVQFWTSHVNPMGQFTVQLRTVVRQDVSLLEQVVVNDQVALVAQRIAKERQPMKLLTIDSVFLQYQAALFKRYGLHYCVSCFLGRNVLIPLSSQSSITSSTGAPTLLALTSLFLLRQSPPLELLPALGNVLNQAITTASNHSLLLPATAGSGQYYPAQVPPPQPQEAVPEFSALIPHRKQDPNLLMSSNPFASSAVIADKQARRLYGAIDGHTSVADLCKTVRVDMNTVFTALQLLLKQQRVELYGPDGQLVNPLLFFKNL